MDYADPAAWRELTDRLTRRHPPELGPCGRVTCEPGWLWKPALTDHDLWLVLAWAAAGSGWVPTSTRCGPARC